MTLPLSLLEGWLVGGLVVGSLLYTVWRFLPAAWQVRLQVRLGMRVKQGACGCDACPSASTHESGRSAP